MSDVELELRKVEVVSKTLEVIRNVYFYEKEKKDKMITDCLNVIETSLEKIQ